MRIACCFILSATVGMVSAAEPKAKPNVVVIIADELGPRDLGCAGSTYYKTPNLDAFAKQGVKLDEAYSHGSGEPFKPFAFEYALSLIDTPLGSTLTAKPTRPPAMAHQKLVTVVPRFKLVDALREVGNLPPEFRTAGYADYSGLSGTSTADYARRFQGNPGTPFFAVIRIHGKLEYPDDALAEYKPGRVGSQGDPMYAVRVATLDRRAGYILKALEEAKLASNTFVIFTSLSSGNSVEWQSKQPATSNSPYREGKGYLYEGGLRVPFLIRGPNVKSGGFPIIGSDILPTVLGLCGIETKVKYDGVDLSPQLRGEAKPDASRSFHWHMPWYTQSFGKPGGAIRVGSLKVIEYFETDRRELFDLSKDIGESKNLAAEKPEVVKDLSAKLAAWRKEVGAKMPLPNPDYKPNPQADDGSITLLGRTAFVTGVQLRFEPAPHKNTLGYWTNPADTAHFEFTVAKPGTFAVSVLQGAGKGSGGAEVELAVGESKARFTVKDTGGFQQFEMREVGELKIENAGRHTLTVTPKSKPGVAVMDLRQVKLTPKK